MEYPQDYMGNEIRPGYSVTVDPNDEPGTYDAKVLRIEFQDPENPASADIAVVPDGFSDESIVTSGECHVFGIV